MENLMENVFINFMIKKGFTYHEALLYLRKKHTNINSYIEIVKHVKAIVSFDKEGITRYFGGKNA